MEKKLFDIPIDTEYSLLGGIVFSKCSSIRRRVNYLSHAEAKSKVVRRRTVRRCLEVINEKGNDLSRLLCGSSPLMLHIIIKHFIHILVEKNIIREDQSLITYLRVSRTTTMPTEAEKIVVMLEAMGVDRRHFLAILRGDTVGRIIQVADQDTYRFIRKVLSLPKYT